MRIDSEGFIRFGKHSGHPLDSLFVPTDYLEWCLENVHFTAGEYSQVQAEVTKRRSTGGQQKFTGAGFGTGSNSSAGYSGSRQSQTNTPPPAPPKAPRNLSGNMMLKVVAAGRKALAKTHHPDAGGDPADMVAINNAADYLETVARGIA